MLNGLSVHNGFPVVLLVKLLVIFFPLSGLTVILCTVPEQLSLCDPAVGLEVLVVLQEHHHQLHHVVLEQAYYAHHNKYSFNELLNVLVMIGKYFLIIGLILCPFLYLYKSIYL